MGLYEALAIVLELAEQNVIDDPDMDEAHQEQEQAIDIVRSFYEKD